MFYFERKGSTVRSFSGLVRCNLRELTRLPLEIHRQYCCNSAEFLWGREVTHWRFNHLFGSANTNSSATGMIDRCSQPLITQMNTLEARYPPSVVVTVSVINGKQRSPVGRSDTCSETSECCCTVYQHSWTASCPIRSLGWRWSELTDV